MLLPQAPKDRVSNLENTISRRLPKVNFDVMHQLPYLCPKAESSDPSSNRFTQSVPGLALLSYSFGMCFVDTCTC